jgi:hypothetical protein
MNQRLTELYRSCRPKEALASQDAYGSADVLLGTEVAKFAELIVQECIDVVDHDDGATHVRELLLEHFGVEL